MFKCKSVLAIGAHPDDIEYGCLGFLLKQEASVKKHVYIASLGSKGDASTGLHRKRESEAACQILKPDSIQVHERAGLGPEDFTVVLDELFSLINKIQPELILTLGPHDTHQEHKFVYDATIAAARRSKGAILSYGILSNTLEFRPQMFIDIAEVYEKKKKALAEHKSQHGKYYMSPEYLDIFHSHNYACLHGIRFSESFEVVRLFG